MKLLHTTTYPIKSDLENIVFTDNVSIGFTPPMDTQGHLITQYPIVKGKFSAYFFLLEWLHWLLLEELEDASYTFDFYLLVCVNDNATHSKDEEDLESQDFWVSGLNAEYLSLNTHSKIGYNKLLTIDLILKNVLLSNKVVDFYNKVASLYHNGKKYKKSINILWNKPILLIITKKPLIPESND